MTRLSLLLALLAPLAHAADPCDDLRAKARRLRNGARDCGQMVSQGNASTCDVEVPFSIPALADLEQAPHPWTSGLPWHAQLDQANRLADTLDAVASKGDPDACRGKRVVTGLTVTVDPPGPLAAGATFTLTATVTMADGASPEGIVISIEPESSRVVALRPVEGALSGTRISKKAALRPAAGPLDIAQQLTTNAQGIASILGTLAPALGDGRVVIHDVIDSAKNEDLIIRTGPKVQVLTEGPPDCSVKDGEDVWSRFIDGTRLSTGFLPKHEQAGGHTILDHVGKGAAELIAQLTTKPAASSYPDESAAEKTIRDTVTLLTPAITLWLATPGLALQPRNQRRKGLFFPGAPGVAVGTRVAQNDRVPRPVASAKTVLELQSDCRLLIFTSYPAIPKE